MYALQVDPESLQATTSFIATPRQGQQSELYNLSISNFLRPDSLKIEQVTRTGDDLEVVVRFTHPFRAAQDIFGTPSAANREDLAVTGRVLLLTEGADVYFNGDVRTHATVLANPDGFFQPGPLLPDTGLIANTFPYKLLVDERIDNRIGVSNGGQPTGNYSPVNGGWQTSQFLAGPTGYDLIAQGQASRIPIVLDGDALASGVSLRLAVMVKYEDPRGGTNSVSKRANRLPSNDVTRFAYRMPHGALDVGRVDFSGETGGLISNTISATTITVAVRDWDARANEAGQTNLAGESNVSLVSAGESGIPVAELSLPDLLGASTVPLSHVDNGETGHPLSELIFEGLVTNPSTSGQPAGGATWRGLVRVTDVTDITPPADWAGINRFNLDPSLTPVTPVFEGATYQTFSVNLQPQGGNTPPDTLWQIVPSVINDGGTCQVQLTSITDPDDATVNVLVNWGDGNGYVVVGTNVPTGGAPVAYTSPAYSYTATPPNPDVRTLGVRLQDSAQIVDATNSGGDQLTILEALTCANPPKVGTDVGSMWAQTTLRNADSGIAGLPAGNNDSTHDMAAFRGGTYGGFFLFQNVNLGTPDRDFYRIEGSATPTAIEVTTGDLGGFMTGRVAYQMDVDSTNRIIFARRPTSVAISHPLRLYPGSGSPAEEAQPDLYWFDYTGTPVSAIGGTISTAGARVIATTIGQNDDIYMIDDTHVLHRYIRASGYAEDTSAPYPINLLPLIGDPLLTGSARRRVHDFVLNWHNQAFFILVGSDVATDNGYLHRINCDGTQPPGSPANFTLNNSSGNSRPGDLAIDQINSAGNLVPEGDVQMITGSGHAGTGGPDMRLWNSELVNTASVDFGTSLDANYRICIAFASNNTMLSRASLLEAFYVWYLTPPVASWQ